MSYCLIGQTIKSKAPVNVFTGNTLLLCVQLRSTAHQNVSTLYIGGLPNFRSFDVGTMRSITPNGNSIDLSDVSVSGSLINTLNALLKPKCSFHLRAFAIDTFTRIRIVLSLRAEHALLDRISVNSRSSVE